MNFYGHDHRSETLLFDDEEIWLFDYPEIEETNEQYFPFIDTFLKFRTLRDDERINWKISFLKDSKLLYFSWAPSQIAVKYA